MNSGEGPEAIVDRREPCPRLPAGPLQIRPSIEAWLFLGIALVAAVLRILVMGGSHRMIAVDGISYIEIAKDIGNRFSFFSPVFPPGYPMWMALLQKLTGLGWLQAGRWTSCIFSLLLLFPLYAVFRRCVSTPAALLGLLFYACLPAWVRYGSETQSISVGAFWFFLALALCLRVVSKADHRAIVMLGAGISLGLAALARPELLVAMVVLPLWVIYRSRKGALWAKPWLILLVCMVVYAPYVLMLHKHTGHWQLSMKLSLGVRNALAVGQPDYFHARDKIHQSSSVKIPGSLLAFWFSDPLATLKRMGINGYVMHRYIWPKLFPVILTCLLALGLIVSAGREMDLLWVVSLVYLPSTTFFIDARIMLPWATPFLAWAGAGAWWLLRWKRPIGVVAICCAMVFLTGGALHSLRRESPYIAARRAGEWLGSHLDGKKGQVWSHRLWVAYYAGVPHHRLPPDADLAAFLAPIPAGSWLVVDNHDFAIACPRAFAQLFAGRVPSRLVLTKQFTGPDGDVLNLYHVGPLSRPQSGPMASR